MKILVTGNLGYIGTHVSSNLKSKGHSVAGIDLNLYPSSLIVKPNIDVQIYNDFRKIDIDFLSNFDAVIHLAALSNDPMGMLNKGLTLEINGYGSIELARKAKMAGVNIFVFSSSCSIYGSGSSKSRTELDSTNPLSEYAESKLIAEKGLAELASSNFHTYLLRNSTAFGYSDCLRLDLVVNDLSANLCAYGIAELKSDGTQWRPLISAHDMARAFTLFVEHDPIEVNGQPVNVGFDSENFQIREVAELITAEWQDAKLRMSAAQFEDPRNYKVSFARLRGLFPTFEAEQPLRTAIPILRDKLLGLNYDAKDRNAGRFIRLIELRENFNKIEI